MENWDLSTNKHYSSYVGKYSEIVSDAAHFETFHKDKPKKRMEKLKVFYHANLMLRYQEYKLEKEIKDEKAKARASTTSPKYRKTMKVDDILRLKLENDRFREKIAALDNALFEDHGVINQSHLPPETTQLGNRTTQAGTSNVSFAKKKLATIGGTSAIKKPESTSQKFHVNTLTGKQDPDLREKMREYELWSRHLQSSKDDLAKVNRLLKAHKERTGLDGGTRTHIKYPSELERDNLKLNLRIEPLEKAIEAKREQQYRLAKDLEAVSERLLEEQEKGRTIQNMNSL